MRPMHLTLSHLASLPRLHISKWTFDQLGEYSVTIPTGVFFGKLWKAQLWNGRWVVRGYEIDPTDPKMALIRTWKPFFAVRDSRAVTDALELYRVELEAHFKRPTQ